MSRNAAVLAQLESERPNVSYADFQARAESALVDLLKSNGGSTRICRVRELPLWLAAHRLVKKGIVREGALEHFFKLQGA